MQAGKGGEGEGGSKVVSASATAKLAAGSELIPARLLEAGLTACEVL